MHANFPSVDDKHLTNNAAKLLFGLVSPSTWNSDPRDGDNDFGFDYEVQVAPNQQVSHTFRAQLKGTRSPDISSDGTKLSMELSRTTLNLYANTTEPVLLVVAVLELDGRGKPDQTRSRVYWQWIPEEWYRLRGSAHTIDESAQKKITLHVPLANELTPDFDVVPWLNRKIQEARATETLADIVRKAAEPTFGGVDEPMRLLAARAEANPEAFRAILFQDADEAHPPREGTPQFLLFEITSHLRGGKTALAEDLYRRLDKDDFASTPTLQASFLSVGGKLAMQRMRKEDALRLFEDAYRHHPIEKHLLPQEEVRFLMALGDEDDSAVASVAEALSRVETDDGLGLLLRVQVALSQFAEASSTLSRISAEKRATPSLVLLSGQQKWREAEIEADEALSQRDVSIQDAATLRLLAARACWQQALAPTSAAATDEEIPLPGLPGLDRAAARRAWQHASACLDLLKDLGWPLNVELLAPVAVASAGALGRQQDALRLLRQAGLERPEYGVLQENLELLALNIGDSTLALEVNARQPRSHEVLVRRAILLFQVQRFSECLSIAKELASDLEASCKHTPMALAAGYAVAVKLVRIEDADHLLAVLRANPTWAEAVHFAAFAEQSLQFEGNADPLDALRVGLREFPASRFLAANLFSNLRVDQETTAREAIVLARMLRQSAAFTLEECLHLIAAHLTGEEWQEAENEARLAIEQFGETGRLVSMVAFAVEMQGKTGEALSLLEKAVALEQDRFSTLHNYLSLNLRLGRMTTAQDTIEKLLALDTDREGRLELLRLSALIWAQQGEYDKALSVAHTLGRTVRQDVEVEEGMYLNLYMGVTLSGPPVPESTRDAVGQRVEAFCSTWPQSGLFRRVQVPERGITTLDDLHDILDSDGGNSRRDLREFQARERQARSGDFPVPFVARPGFVFHYIGDVFTLWGVSKRSSPDDRQYHLSSVPLRDESATTMAVLRDVPLLDLTALLVLHDLGQFPALFSLFPRVAVPRSTIDYIAQHARGLMVDQEVVQVAGSLLATINENLQRIDVPSPTRSGKVVTTRDLLNDYLQLASSRRWATYTDDAVTRAWLQEDRRPHHLCTSDLLTIADCEGLLPPAQVAFLLEQMASWNVGLMVGVRYLISSLEGAVADAESLTASQRLERFQVHRPFASLARAVWGPDKPTKALVLHMGAIVAEMLAHPRTQLESAAAVWAFWVIRIRLMPGTNAEGWGFPCWSLLMALKQLPHTAASRALSAFLMMVEAVVGADRMIDREQKKAIVVLGTKTGDLMRRNSQIGNELRSKIEVALPAGTADGDTFVGAYLDALREENRN